MYLAQQEQTSGVGLFEAKNGVFVTNYYVGLLFLSVHLTFYEHGYTEFRNKSPLNDLKYRSTYDLIELI